MKLSEVATVLRSKDTSPFRTAFDIFFEDKSVYERFKESKTLNADSVARLYKLPIDYVQGIYFVDQLFAIKINIRRVVPSDEQDACDPIGSSQIAPLCALEIPSG